MTESEKILMLRRPAQVAALASPVRAGIVDTLASYGASSVRELSDALGVRPESLYYHVRVLQKQGLVIQHSKRKHKRRHEAVYALAAPRLALDRTKHSRRYLEAVAKSGETLLRASARDYRLALCEPGGLREHTQNSLCIRRLVAPLDRAGVRRLKHLLDQIAALFESYQDRHREHVQSLTIALVPRRKANSASRPLRQASKTPVNSLLRRE